MKQLNIQKLTTVDTNELAEMYKSQYVNALNDCNLLNIQIKQYQKIIQDIADKNIDAIPAEYLTEVKNNGSNNR